jgi:hypothetical protein
MPKSKIIWNSRYSFIHEQERRKENVENEPIQRTTWKQVNNNTNRNTDRDNTAKSWNKILEWIPGDLQR